MAIIPDPPITAYEPFFRPGLTAMVCRTLGGEPIFRLPEAAHLWQSSLRRLQADHPFRLLGYVTVPDQVWVMLMPTGSSPAAKVMDRALAYFTADYRSLMGDPGRMMVWDRQVDHRPVADVPDFAAHLDRIHYAPVAAGLVPHPEEWPHSSYRAWIDRGLYKLGWGWTPPGRLQKSK
ncbi:MAG: hypothetical protein KBG20_05575 [Caldilineaceae bacterium]|nr:hypothetical protein [Caldilineaceae bacterium]MBP8106696.1 hypothetical protein [Caldilineaceae bacterium]MBP8122164.1 hypothetical protein [Caldilineaceae bacterium]MBP9071747.1 hypothetical protein [Caldilineaceae bacterium]